MLSVGSLDTTFDLDGKATAAIGLSHDIGRALAIQSDGKIVVAGESSNGSYHDFALARFNADGSLDTSFDGDGKLTTAVGESDDTAHALALQSDGKILVAGRTDNGSNYDVALVRYLADGTLDTTFDGDGKVITDIGGADDVGYSVTVQSDGKILVAGASFIGSNRNFALARYNADGSLDASFDGDGRLTTDFYGKNDLANSMVVQSDGRIVLAGTSSNGANNDFALARYNPDGSLDTSFDGDGKVTTAFGTANDAGWSVALQTDGKILVAGASVLGTSDFALARYLANGSLDTSWSGDGKVNADFGSYDAAYGVAVQNDGRIVVAGYGGSAGNYNFELARYLADGSLDTSWDGDGKATTGIGSTDDSAYCVAVQADGKIIAAGVATIDGNSNFAVVRYEGVDGYDYGDAPDGYGTLESSDGAKHGATGPTLGASRDVDSDGHPTAGATGDDAIGADDEDGVTFGPIEVGQVTASVTVNVQNASSGAKLDAWIDFDADGAFTGPGEQIASALALANGDNLVSFDVPASAVTGTTYARFRISNAGNLSATGPAPDGEIEDYQITVELADIKIAVLDNSGAIDDAAVQFSTPLSQYRTGTEDSPLVRPAFPDDRHYVDVTNSGQAPLRLSETQLSVANVSLDIVLTSDPTDDIFLAPGQTQRFHLTYAPTTPTLSGAVGENFSVDNGLVFLSNAINAPQLAVALRGASTFDADITCDGQVNLNEVGILNANYGKSSAEANFDPTADMTGDGKVNLSDLGPLNAQYGKRLPMVLVSESSGSTAVDEGGASDTYTVVLLEQPAATVTVSIVPDAQTTVDPAELTFTTADWSSPRTVTVRAVDDASAEGSHESWIAHAVTSADAAYNGLPVMFATSSGRPVLSNAAKLKATVSDNDASAAPMAVSEADSSSIVPSLESGASADSRLSLRESCATFAERKASMAARKPLPAAPSAATSFSSYVSGPTQKTATASSSTARNKAVQAAAADAVLREAQADRRTPSLGGPAYGTLDSILDDIIGCRKTKVCRSR